MPSATKASPGSGRKCFGRYLLLVMLLSAGGLFAQSDEGFETLWKTIEARFDTDDDYNRLEWLRQTVEAHCAGDLDCLDRTFAELMQRMEHLRFDLVATIFIAEELVEVSQKRNDLMGEAGANLNLQRYHDALGNDRLATLSLDRAIELLEQTGNHHAITNARMNKLEQELRFRDGLEVLADMQALLHEAEDRNDSASITFMHIRLAGVTTDLEQYEAALPHIAYLDQIPLSTPLKQEEFVVPITSNLAKGDVARDQGRYDEAEAYYQETLRLCRLEPSRWIEIYTLIKLADMEWSRGRTGLGRSYLTQAREKGEALDQHDLLVTVFLMLTRLAEEEGRFEEALRFNRLHHEHREKLEARQEGFDIQNYYLQVEKDQLATEKKNQELTLQIREDQLRSSLIITLLALLLAVALAWAFYKQRRRRQELAAQHQLIKQQATRLAKVDEVKSRFFANVSHELRTPLTLLLGPISSVLQAQNISAPQERLLRLAQQSGKQLRQLVDEILDLSKLEMGKMQVEPLPTLLDAFVRQNLAPFHDLAHERDIRLTYHGAASPDRHVYLDRPKFRQILNNLVANACKYAPTGSSIRVELDHQRERLMLTVTDDGPGISPDDLPHIFDRYYQTSDPERRAEGGTGIGLALCREYARLLGGNITVESAPGRGARFHVYFPAEVAERTSEAGVRAEQAPPSPSESTSFPATWERPEPKPATSHEDGEPPPTDTKQATVLVVEDHPDLRAYLSLILSDRFEVVTAEHGKAAWEWLRENGFWKKEAAQGKPLLIISDLMMPVMDGYQLLEKLKGTDATRHLPVIMLTARTDLRDKLRALRIGVDDYLTKPFVEVELLAHIDNLLRLYRLRQAESEPSQADEEAPTSSAPPRLSRSDTEWLQKLESILEAQLGNSEFNMSWAADEMDISTRQLRRRLRQLTGLSPNHYLREMRLQHARRLLESGAYSTVKEISYQVGFRDTPYFSRLFQERFGINPSTIDQ